MDEEGCRTAVVVVVHVGVYILILGLEYEKITGDSWLVRDEWRKTNVRRSGTYGLTTIPIQLKATGVKKSIDDAL